MWEEQQLDSIPEERAQAAVELSTLNCAHIDYRTPNCPAVGLLNVSKVLTKLPFSVSFRANSRSTII